ncbi:MAG: hypothetical protein QXL18_05215 [Candidatus Woesearchaeota archaeon]
MDFLFLFVIFFMLFLIATLQPEKENIPQCLLHKWEHDGKKFFCKKCGFKTGE